MNVAAILIISFVACVAGVAAFRKLAARSALLLDVPNERSSHSQPVVRGSGIVIVLTVLAAYLLSGSEVNLVYLAAAGSIALVSLLDDLFSIPLLPRLAVHFAAATALVYWSAGYPGINLPLLGSELEFGMAAPVISILFIVGATNAYNFMDGIDGIAGIQGVGAGLGWMLFGLVTGHLVMAAFGAAITGACLGFLLFNWQPARVFMGDVGSTFLGFTLASVPLIAADTTAAARTDGLLLAAMFLWLFLFDTVYTRLRQIARLRPFWRAHREHLYQLAVVGGASHRSTALFFGAFALLTAVTAALGPIGLKFSIALLVSGPIALLLFAGKKRLT